jgi:1,4-dihydroxy-2-naphthoate octaprenyltransferase
MKFSLPPKLREMRGTIARNHNRRVLLVMVAFFTWVLLALLLARRHQAADWTVLVSGMVMVILGVVHIIRLSKKQSVALGFVCPLCGGALCDGRDNRLEPVLNYFTK